MNGKHPQAITLPSNPVPGRWHARRIFQTTYDRTFSPFLRVVNRATLRLFPVCLALSACSTSTPTYTSYEEKEAADS